MQIRLLLLGAMLACSAGCSRFSAPTVSVNEVSVIDATQDALALSFVMDLKNPNQAAVPLHEFRYTVSINGKEVYAGRRAGGATLSAVHTRQVLLPAVVPFDKLGWNAQELPASMSYRVQGQLQFIAPNRLAQILFDTGVRKPKVSFKGRGEIHLR
jgi:LEA14-like dessication related protein